MHSAVLKQRFNHTLTFSLSEKKQVRIIDMKKNPNQQHQPKTPETIDRKTSYQWDTELVFNPERLQFLKKTL